VHCTHFCFKARTLNVPDRYRHKMNKDLAHLTYERVKRTTVTQGWNVFDVISPFYGVSHDFLDHIIRKPPKLAEESELVLWRNDLSVLRKLLAQIPATTK
jgi:hypothetical protein